MDEVLRAYLCQFTCINTLAASPSLGFYLRLITLYLLMPCRNMLFFPPWWREAGSRSVHLHCSLLEHWQLRLSKMELVKMSKSFPRGCCCRWGFTCSPTGHQRAAGKWALLGLDLSLAPPFINTKCPQKDKTTNLSLKGKHMITSPFVIVTCPCRTEKSFEHTPRRAANLSYGSLVKWPHLKNTLQKEWSLTAKESGVFFAHE